MNDKDSWGINMTKRIFVLLSILSVANAYAAHPIETCAALGLDAFPVLGIILAKDQCPNGTTQITSTGTNSEPVACGNGKHIPLACTVYAPAGQNYSDNAGTYSYSDACYLD